MPDEGPQESWPREAMWKFWRVELGGFRRNAHRGLGEILHARRGGVSRPRESTKFSVAPKSFSIVTTPMHHAGRQGLAEAAGRGR